MGHDWPNGFEVGEDQEHLGQTPAKRGDVVPLLQHQTNEAVRTSQGDKGLAYSKSIVLIMYCYKARMPKNQRKSRMYVDYFIGKFSCKYRGYFP